MQRSTMSTSSQQIRLAFFFIRTNYFDPCLMVCAIILEYSFTLYKKVTFRGNWVTLTVSTILIRKDERALKKIITYVFFSWRMILRITCKITHMHRCSIIPFINQLCPKSLRALTAWSATLSLESRQGVQWRSSLIGLSIYCYFDYNFFYCSWFSYLLTLSLVSISCMGYCNVLPFFYKVTSHFLL